MKLDIIKVRVVPEDYELDLILRERDYERRMREVVTPSRAFYRGLGIGLLFSCAIAALIWKFFL